MFHLLQFHRHPYFQTNLRLRILYWLHRKRSNWGATFLICAINVVGQLLCCCSVWSSTLCLSLSLRLTASLSRATIVWRHNSWNFWISIDLSNQGLSYGTIAICTCMYLCSHVLWKYEIMIFFADCSSRVTPIWRHFSWNGESLNANHWDCKSFPFMRYRENAGNLLSPLYQSIYIHSDRD